MIRTQTIAFSQRLSGATTRAVEPEIRAEPPPIDYVAEDRERIARLLTELERRAAAADVERRVPVEELARIAIELGVALAAKLVHAKIAADEFGIESLVRGAVDRLPTRQPVEVSLHPDDLALLGKHVGDPAEWIAGRSIRLVSDDRLHRGDCKAAVGDVGVWSELQRQLWELRDLLLEGLPAEYVESASG